MYKTASESIRRGCRIRLRRARCIEHGKMRLESVAERDAERTGLALASAERW